MDRAALKLVDFSHLGRGGVRAASPATSNGFPHGLGRSGVHEVCARAYGDGAAAAGFAVAAGLAGPQSGAVAWIGLPEGAGADGSVSARGLLSLGAPAGRFLHITTRRPMEALWAAEEAVTSSAVACVVAECRDLDFTASRRLTLASEARGTPVILLLPHTRSGATAANGRWRLSAAPSAPNRLNPRGLGRPRWDAALERSRTAPAAIGRHYTLEFDHETFSLHMAGQLGARPFAPQPVAAHGPERREDGLRRAG